MRGYILLILALLLVLPLAFTQEGKLGSFEQGISGEEEAEEEETEKEKKEKARRKKKEEKEKKEKKEKKQKGLFGEEEEEETSNFGEEFFKGCMEGMMTGCMEGLTSYMSESFQQPRGYLSYPFASGEQGYVNEDGKSWMVNISQGWQYVDDSTYALRSAATVGFASRYALEAAYTDYREELADGEAKLSFTDAVLSCHLVCESVALFSLSGGIARIKGERTFDGGKMSCRLRLFLRPVHLDLAGSATMGDFNTVTNYSVNIGYHLNRFDLSCGYDWRNVLDLSLNGPVISAGLWF